jgi:hypothetical protein
MNPACVRGVLTDTQQGQATGEVVKTRRNPNRNAHSERAEDRESRAPARARKGKGPQSLSKSRISERSAKPVERPAERPDETAEELALVGPHPTDPDRNALGRYTTDNDGHLSIGTHSEKRWAALRAALRAERVRFPPPAPQRQDTRARPRDAGPMISAIGCQDACTEFPGHLPCGLASSAAAAKPRVTKIREGTHTEAGCYMTNHAQRRDALV